MKLLVPAGYMLHRSGGTMAIVPCSGTGPMPMPAMAAMPGMKHGGGADHGKAERPCPFAALAAPALAGADPVLLALAIAFITACGVIAVRPPAIRPRAFLRPPLRGPPGAA